MSVAAGREAEGIAANYLRKRGLTVVTRNWRGGGGELDLVLLDGDTLVIAEVKRRPLAAAAVAAVDAAKARRIASATTAFLRAAELAPENVRFDIVTVDAETGTVEHHPDAFRP